MTDNVVPLRRAHLLRLSPTSDRVLRLLERANRKAARDPVQTYGDLLSAAVIAARLIGLTREQIDGHVSAFIPQADAARANRPDIFGGQANDR
jgi:hypothetical protein